MRKLDLKSIYSIHAAPLLKSPPPRPRDDLPTLPGELAPRFEFRPAPTVAPPTLHLLGAFLALLALAALTLAGVAYAGGVEEQYVHALAPEIFMQKSLGNAIQEAALREHDLLTLYGGSELSAGGRYRASALLHEYPTGFNVFSVGLHGAGSLSILQELAGSGSNVRGKKIALFVTPFFFMQPMEPPQWFEFNFSDLNANALAFNTDLSLDVRQAAAKRMRQYPKALRDDPVLQFALDTLAEGTPFSQVLYFTVLPLGQAHLNILRLQDHWEMLNYIRDHPELEPQVKRESATMDWGKLAEQAARDYPQRTSTNPYGIDDQDWETNRAAIEDQKNKLTDGKYLKLLQASAEWKDLDLLLRSLKELGAQPLLMTVPLHGPYYDYRGVSTKGRQPYYAMFEEAGKRYGIPVITFKDREYDIPFFGDISDHPSARGWVLYDQVLDDFYHDRIR